MTDTTPGRALTMREIRQALGHIRPKPPTPVPTPPPGRTAAPIQAAADGLVVHGDPIDIGWAGGALDARLLLSVRPGMDAAEREQLLADLRDALASIVPIRRTGREVSS